MDPETQKIYQEGEAINDFIQTKAWKIIKEKITEKMLDLQSVLNIDFGSEKSMSIEVRGRQLAASYLYDILRDVEGIASQHKANKPLAEDFGVKVI